MPNYRDDAKKEADEIDKKIVEVLSQKKNFRVLKNSHYKLIIIKILNMILMRDSIKCQHI